MSHYPLNMTKPATAFAPAGFAVAHDASEEADLKSHGYGSPAAPDVGAQPKAPETAAPSPQLMYEAGRLGVEVQADWSTEQIQKAVDEAKKKGDTAPKTGDRTQLEADASSLGVKFDGRTSTAKLADMVADAKSKKG